MFSYNEVLTLLKRGRRVGVSSMPLPEMHPCVNRVKNAATHAGTQKRFCRITLENLQIKAPERHCPLHSKGSRLGDEIKNELKKIFMKARSTRQHNQQPDGHHVLSIIYTLLTWQGESGHFLKNRF